jgi:hypothetical protein
MRGAVLFVCYCGCLAAQQASIEGTALNAVTREPLGDVHIRLVALPGLTTAYGAISDRTGHFAIATIRPGAYLPDPQRSGFLFVRKTMLPTLIVKPGEHAEWTVEMTPRTVLSGHVLDENGDPVQGIEVRTLPAGPANPWITSVARFGTDDRGEFRLVAPPGKFYVLADLGRPSNDRLEARTDGSSELRYVTTFYPSSPAKDRATMVEVVAGNPLGGLDIRLQRQHSTALTGTVSGLPEISQGTRALVDLQFGESAQGPFDSRTVTAGADGKFSFPGAAPGFYRLWATYGSGKTQMASRTVPLQLGNGDQPTVELALTRGIDLAGLLVMVGDAPGTPPEKRTVRLLPIGTAGGAWEQSGGEVEKDGAFHLENVAPARFRVQVTPLAENAYVQTVEVDGAASGDGTVDFSAARPARLKLTIDRNGAQIAGAVLDEKGERILPAVSLVLLLPDPNDLDTGSILRVMPDGQFVLKGVRPGKYRLLAVDGSLQFIGSREKIRQLAEHVDEIEIKAGDRIDKDLRLQPMEDASAKPKQ